MKSGKQTKVANFDSTQCHITDAREALAQLRGSGKGGTVARLLLDRKTEITNLPVGWIETNLSCIVSKLVDGSHNPPAKQDTGLPMLSAININDNKIAFSSYRLIQEAAFLQEDKRTRISTGDVLLTIVGAIGRSAVVPEHHEKFTLQRSVAVITPIFVNSKFLMYQFEAPKTAKYFQNNARGTAQKGVYLKTLGQTEVILPPLPEQLRIVAKIEELFSELDKGIESLKTAREQLKVYRQALLKHAFEGKGLVKKGLITQPFGEDCFFTLGDVIDSLGQGWSPRCLETPSQSDDVWGVIKTTAIQPLHFNDTKNKQLPTELKPRPHLEIIPGDVLITRAGPRTRVGIACFVKNVRPKLMVCDKAYRLQVRKEKILPQYLVMLLNTSALLSELEKLKSGISDSGLNLTQDKFLTLKITVPSLKHQQIILTDIEEKLTNVEFLETQIDNSLQQSVSLRQSILKKAFSGRLVSQDPHDEPASVLLERIRAEKTGAKKSEHKKTGKVGRPRKKQEIPHD